MSWIVVQCTFALNKSQRISANQSGVFVRIGGCLKVDYKKSKVNRQQKEEGQLSILGRPPLPTDAFHLHPCH